MLNVDEMQRLNRLVRDALSDADIRDQLLHEKDERLFDRYDLSNETRHLLRGSSTTSLKGVAQMLLKNLSNYSIRQHQNGTHPPCGTHDGHFDAGK